MGSSKGVMDAPRDLRGVSRAHLMLGNSITDVVHFMFCRLASESGVSYDFDAFCYL